MLEIPNLQYFIPPTKTTTHELSQGTIMYRNSINPRKSITFSARAVREVQ